jgi:hypothetical protein
VAKWFKRGSLQNCYVRVRIPSPPQTTEQYAFIAQRIEHLVPNQKVGGSNPFGGTLFVVLVRNEFMPSKKQHYSTVTNDWERCRADKKPCRYADHRGGDDLEKQKLLSQIIKANLPETVKLTALDGEKGSKRIKKPGTTGKRCRNCNAMLTQANVDELYDNTKPMEDRTTNCPSCSTGCLWYEFNGSAPYHVDINPEEAHLLLDENAVRETRWYHSSTSENWAESVETAGVLIHAGTLSAAHDRMNDLIGQNPQTDRTHKTHYLYEMKIKPGSALNKNILFDDNNFPSNPNEENEADLNAKTVSRYVNEWENPGSVSLISVIDNFEIVKRTVLK